MIEWRMTVPEAAPMPAKWDLRFIGLARYVATWSKDPSTQVGCAIVDDSRRVRSIGYNGHPQGVIDNEIRYTDRETKYRLIVHADLNAIYSATRAGVPLVGTTMYLTAPPCCECMKGIIQVGIKRVVWPKDNPFEQDPATRERWAESTRATEVMAGEAGVAMDRV